MRWTADTWIGLSAAVIAGCALVLSICEGVARRTHDRLSVYPEVQLGFYHAKDWAGWKLANVGLGPARIRWFEVTVDGKPQPHWRAVADALGLPLPRSHYFSVPHRNTILQLGETYLFRVDGPVLIESLRAARDRVALRICYCSLYGECWEQRGQGEGPVESTCEGQPEVEFTSNPPRPDNPAAVSAPE